MEYTYVVVRLLQNGQSEVELTTDDVRLAEQWVAERRNAVDGMVTNYQILTVPYAMPPQNVATGSNANYVAGTTLGAQVPAPGAQQ